MIELVEKELKSIKQIMAQNPDYEWKVYSDGVTAISDKGNWHINGDMVGKFGDCKTYLFKKVTPAELKGRYTHSHEQYFYHESWFVGHDPEPLPEDLFEI